MTYLGRFLGDLRPSGRQPGGPFAPKVVAPVPILCRHFGHDLPDWPAPAICRDCGARPAPTLMHQPTGPCGATTNPRSTDVNKDTSIELIPEDPPPSKRGGITSPLTAWARHVVEHGEPGVWYRYPETIISSRAFQIKRSVPGIDATVRRAEGGGRRYDVFARRVEQ